ncbi:5-Enolpyruvylshikimate-3-phosphate synthase [Formosa agariphila KMM 3901]|uniref:3-phosphoshikimate 1-carboxyvinyltransferase n=1 Tax=Formosa agariphila (strain DSM 15362 / KCTC 12365 / LMG 23005 / KMM 3901 / M-2Alg 35-1) TaxID=1347342 RepID=T2KGY4_FORAG|nr:3-phosphoshikimate 1-carboxyvinyltransferase [Formosa agariphila]CDF78087.1 5-Enolpyruvylshikimate-3-phosphate synthase [Formosa agariphila KMM 3901]
MNITLEQSEIIQEPLHVTITGSKSESNRLLVLQALFPNISLENVSNSDDSDVMQMALKSTDDIVDIHHAGTTMRFLTAYFSSQAGKSVTLTGSKRMKERPIKILVDALRDLGADITYVENDGFPPIKISGKKITQNEVTLKANVSSQYISALMLIGSSLEHGLKLTLDGEITSVPYIKMTLNLLHQLGIDAEFEGQVITVQPKLDPVDKQTLIVESDWSSASYFFSIVALSAIGTTITLSAYKDSSLQGDSVLAKIYKQFGVETTFKDNTITLQKVSLVSKDTVITLDLVNAPDIAQTIAVTCFGLGIACDLSGLHTLKIKETDRLEALKTEIEKLGGHVYVTDKTLVLDASEVIQEDVAIDTYNDHRMAMAFAPLALCTKLRVNDAEVVSKSYPEFWSDLEKIGFKIIKN